MSARQIIPVYIVSRGACIEQEKWELQAVNADLQQRLQQTVALAHMQVASPSSCDAELGYLVRYCTMYSVQYIHGNISRVLVPTGIHYDFLYTRQIYISFLNII